MNEQNLIPLNERSPEERREIARKGGLKSGERRRQKSQLIKAFREQMKLYDETYHIVLSHMMKKRYCDSCKYKQRANKERSMEKRKLSGNNKLTL